MKNSVILIFALVFISMLLEGKPFPKGVIIKNDTNSAMRIEYGLENTANNAVIIPSKKQLIFHKFELDSGAIIKNEKGERISNFSRGRTIVFNGEWPSGIKIEMTEYPPEYEIEGIPDVSLGGGKLLYIQAAQENELKISDILKLISPGDMFESGSGEAPFFYAVGIYENGGFNPVLFCDMNARSSYVSFGDSVFSFKILDKNYGKLFKITYGHPNAVSTYGMGIKDLPSADESKIMLLLPISINRTVFAAIISRKDKMGFK